MRKKTAAQIEEDHLLMQSLETETGDDAAAPPATMMIAYGEGEPFKLGGRVLELPQFATKNLKTAYALLDKCPAILSAQAIAGKDGHAVSLEALTDAYNNLLGRSEDNPEKPPIPLEQVAGLMGAFPQIIAENEEPLVPVKELAVLAFSRRQPGFCAADLEDEMDLAFVVRFLRAVIRINLGMTEALLGN